MRTRPLRSTRIAASAFALIAALALVGGITTLPSAEAAAPMVTYAVTAQPGMRVAIGFTSPGVLLHEPNGSVRLPYRNVTIPASGTWSATVPADGWRGGQNVPILAASPAAGLWPPSGSTWSTFRPGFGCSITQDGADLTRDNEPSEYFCLTSTSAEYRK